MRLSQIDELTISDHPFLEGDDVCFYLGEYTSRAGFQHSKTNQLIYNLKKHMSRSGLPEWRYKTQAISESAEQMRNALDGSSLRSGTFVPVPPSKCKDDPHYDDRITQILLKMTRGWQSDVRELILQRSSTGSSHESEERLSVQELITNYFIDNAACLPTPKSLIVFDDVLTTGRHFKAIQHILQERFPRSSITGLFIARRVPSKTEI